MMGAMSLILGLLGLGTAGVVGACQKVSTQKKIDEYNHQSGWDATGDRRKMYDRVRDEWIHMGRTNALGRYAFSYPNGPYCHWQEYLWFKAHLDAKQIPYDDTILFEVSGVNGDIRRNQMLYNDVHGLTRKWRLF